MYYKYKSQKKEASIDLSSIYRAGWARSEGSLSRTPFNGRTLDRIIIKKLKKAVKINKYLRGARGLNF